MLLRRKSKVVSFFRGKKGVAMYIFALLGVSLAMTILFLIILSSIYDTENASCQEIDYEVSGLCNYPTGVEFALANRGDIPFKYLINGDMDSFDEVVVGERKIVKLSLKDVKKVTVTPFLVQRDIVYLCKSKNYVFDKSLIATNC